MARVLVIDDNHSLVRRVSAALRWRGHEANSTADCGRARRIALADRECPDVILLGLALACAHRPPLLPALRKDGFSGPILVWSESREESDIALSFRRGADQYIGIPFGIRELFARVDGALARSRNGEMSGRSTNGAHGPAPDHVYEFDGISVDMRSREVHREGEQVRLSPLEFDLLAALLRREGAATSRTELLREVWKYGPGVVSRTLDTHILNLRAKLEEEPRAPRHILTVRKVGYRLDT